MKRIVAAILICSLIAGDILAVDRKKAVYVGGTIESLNKHEKSSEGELDLKKDAADKPQALILELGKNIEQEARAIISARSGIEVKAIIEEN